jgi:hypothetical protein
VTPGKSYTAGIWVRATASVRVVLNVDWLTKSGGYVDTATSANVTLTANTWTHVTLTAIQPVSGEVYAAMEPNFSRATSGVVMSWDDMTLTNP